MALVLDSVSWALILIGAAVVLIGTFGLLRLPDVYARMHAAGMTETLGAGALLVGMTLQADDWITAVKLLLIWAFLLFTSPVSTHALARSALAGGLRPWSRGNDDDAATRAAAKAADKGADKGADNGEDASS